MEAAHMGYDVAHFNAAIIIEKYQVFSDIDVDIKQLPSRLQNDPIWKALKTSKNFSPSKTINDLLYEDMITIAHSLKFSNT